MLTIEDVLKAPVLKDYWNQTDFIAKVRRLSKIICNFGGYHGDIISMMVDMEIENSCIEFIASWCDIDKELVASDLTLPDFDLYKHEDTFDLFVDKYIENLKKLAAEPEEIRHPPKEVKPMTKPVIDKEKEKLTHHVDGLNCGEHDPDNSFGRYTNILDQIDYWKETHSDCIPIGFCDDRMGCRTVGTVKLISFVYEDQNGNRYFVHVPEEWKEELEL